MTDKELAILVLGVLVFWAAVAGRHFSTPESNSAVGFVLGLILGATIAGCTLYIMSPQETRS